MREELAAKRRDIEARAKALDAEIRALEAKEEVLAELRKELGTSPPSHTNGKRSAAKPTAKKKPASAEPMDIWDSIGKPKPTAAIIDALRRQSMTQPELVDYLESRIDPGAKSPRRALAGAIWYMKKDGKLNEGPDGKLSIAR